MKIIVNNTAELKLIQEFAELLCGGGLEAVEKDDIECSADGNTPYFSNDEYLFLNNAFQNLTVETDAKETPLETDADIVVGTCVSCGKQTEGVLDAQDVDYEEYKRLTSKESIEDWKCMDCYSL